MRIFTILIIMLFATNTSYSQVKISIDSLKICYVVDSTEVYFIEDSLVINSTKEVVDLYDEDLGKGPYISGYITIENQSEYSIHISDKNPQSFLYYEFYANNKIYKLPIWSYGWGWLRAPIEIPSRGRYSINVDAWLFLGSDIYKKKGSAYYREVIEVLPTLQFVFKYNNKIYKSCGIRKVIYIDRD